MASLFVQILLLCRKAGLAGLDHVAVDGTKIKANASKHKAVSYDRMVKAKAELAREMAERLARVRAARVELECRFRRKAATYSNLIAATIPI